MMHASSRAALCVALTSLLFACSRDKWTETSEPTQGDLRAAWGSGGSDVWSVGRDGAAVHGDGATWTQVKLPTTTDIGGIWGSAKDDVWAVGGGAASGHGSSTCVLMHYDGTTWSTRACPFGAENSALLAVHGSSASDVWAVGVGPTAIHWDGNRWAATAVPPRDGRLTGVFSSGDRDAWAVGRSAILHYDGVAWSVAQATSGLGGMWGRAKDDVWSFGATPSDALVMHYDGSSWKQITCPKSGLESIEGAWGARADEIFLVQADGNVYRSNGRSCAPLTKPEARRTHAIWGAGDTFFIVGEDGRTFRHSK